MKQENQIKCPKCSSSHTKKNGKRKTQNRGILQRFQCKECKFRFVIDDGFFRMRNHPKKITCALDLFYKGVSTRKIKEHFKAFYPSNSSHKSVYKWIVKYSKHISKLTDTIKLNIGKEIQVDEMEYHRRQKIRGTGISKDWFIDSIDTETRFMVASDYAHSRGQKEIHNVIKQAKAKTGNQIKICTTDGFLTYGKVIKKIFGTKNINKGIIIHKKVTALKGEGFNVMIERLHNTIRQRTKIFRGFHGSLESANAIMKGFEIFYNYIRPHQAIGCCPYELATNLKLNSENRWLELIRLGV